MKRPQTHKVTVQTALQQAAFDRFVAYLQLIVLLGLTVTFLLSSVSYAKAAEDFAHSRVQDPEVAVLPPVMPEAPLTLAAGCHEGVAVFSVKNNAARWQTRGKISIVEATTGRVVRERRLALGVRQTASFRVPDGDMRGGRYRVTVRLPDGRMTYVKTFTGRCTQPKTDMNAAWR